MSNKRRILLVTLLIAALGFASWLLLRPDPEPTYQGKPLTYWLDGIVHGRSAEATEAVRQIGTNSIPALLRKLSSGDSKIKLKLMQLSRKQHLINIKWRTAENEHFEGQFGFGCLGYQGKPAVPGLIEIYNQNRPGPYNDPYSIEEIFGCIGHPGPDAIPQIVQDTTNSDYAARATAVWSLWQIHSKPELSVPALTRTLHDPDDNIRASAANGLAAFSIDAKSAVPDLIKALGDPFPHVKTAAATALQIIDPAAAAKAGVTNFSTSPFSRFRVYTTQ